MEHKHGVFDSDTRFSINAITRQIKCDPKQKTVIIQNEHNLNCLLPATCHSLLVAA